ncbi:MAG: M20 family metallopeptidase [Candidatus Omnitrophota bacterium]
MIKQERLIQLTRQLIRIPSENPPGNEYRIACFVKKFFCGLGLKPKVYEFKKKRNNIVVILRGKDKKHNLLISPHLDTVPAGSSWKRALPFAGALRNGRIYGRGASDDKGNLAVSLEVIRSLVEEKHVLGYNLIFAATADEETGSSLGLIPLLDKGILKPQAALILDGDDFNIIVAQKGLLHLRVKIQGKSAHGAYPWQGVNAIDAALAALSGIKSYKFVYKKNLYLRPPTINIGKIAGGDKVNVVADWCEFDVDLRFLPGMPASRIIQGVRKIIGSYAKKFSIEILANQLPSQIDPRHPLVKYLRGAIRNYGVSPKITGSEGATVITFFQERNIPAIATGFGSLGCAHSSNEYIKVSHLYKGARVLERFLKNFRFS